MIKSLIDWNFEQPFYKFGLNGAGRFKYECIEDMARDLAWNQDKLGSVDAFRIAARKVFFGAPASRDCLWYTIVKADEFVSRDDDSDY